MGGWIVSCRWNEESLFLAHPLEEENRSAVVGGSNDLGLQSLNFGRPVVFRYVILISLVLLEGLDIQGVRHRHESCRINTLKVTQCRRFGTTSHHQCHRNEKCDEREAHIFMSNVRGDLSLPVARFLPKRSEAEPAGSVTRVGIRWIAVFGFFLFFLSDIDRHQTFLLYYRNNGCLIPKLLFCILVGASKLDADRVTTQ